MARQSGAKHTEAVTPEIISEDWAVSVLPRRKAGAHKWSVGGVVVVAGSPPYAGAAALCCAGAGRSGAGIISAALPRSIAPVVGWPRSRGNGRHLAGGESNSVAIRSAEAIGERLARSAAMVLGPGLGNDAATAALLGTLFGFTRAVASIGFGTAAPGPDAATLRVRSLRLANRSSSMLMRSPGWQSKRTGGNASTQTPGAHPHPGEMARLVDAGVEEVVANPELIAREAATRWGQTVVLKGGRTVVASADGTICAVDAPRRSPPRVAGMFCADRLARLLAQGLSGPDAAALAVFVGCRSGSGIDESTVR